MLIHALVYRGTYSSTGRYGHTVLKLLQYCNTTCTCIAILSIWPYRQHTNTCTNLKYENMKISRLIKILLTISHHNLSEIYHFILVLVVSIPFLVTVELCVHFGAFVYNNGVGVSERADHGGLDGPQSGTRVPVLQ